MISWIVASHDPAVLNSNLLATLPLVGRDELIVVEGAESITKAYNEGQDRANNPIRCYIHHDVQILALATLRAALAIRCRPDVGMVGVVGCRNGVVPWWEGDCLGSVEDSRMGVLDWGRGGQAGILDGLLLATAQTLTWDEAYPGWHMYDHDACMQMLARGLPNWCLTGGRSLVRHNTGGSHRVQELQGWDENVERFKAKWGADV